MSLHFELVSPEKVVFSGEVASVVIPGTEGEITVLPQHAPLMTTLGAGTVVVKAGNTSNPYVIRGGIADISSKGLTVLAEHVEA
jgi:F-type H+-transporting ATPase subunit epsilon